MTDAPRLLRTFMKRLIQGCPWKWLQGPQVMLHTGSIRCRSSRTAIATEVKGSRGCSIIITGDLSVDEKPGSYSCLGQGRYAHRNGTQCPLERGLAEAPGSRLERTTPNPNQLVRIGGSQCNQTRFSVNRRYHGAGLLEVDAGVDQHSSLQRGRGTTVPGKPNDSNPGGLFLTFPPYQSCVQRRERCAGKSKGTSVRSWWAA